MNAVGEETDIVIFGVNFRYEDKRGEEKYTVSVKPERAVCSTAEEIGSLIAELDGRALFPYMWNKLYRTEFLKSSGVEFNSIQSMEDFFFNIELIPKAKSVAALDFSCFDKFTYFHRFVHMTTFTLVCGLLFRIFGVSVFAVQLASALLSGLCIFIIYLIGKKISGEKLGLICALLYAAFIPSIAYCAVFTSENFAMPFLLLSLYFVISAYRSVQRWAVCANMLAAGAFLAVGCLFRGVAPFYISAYVIGALTVFAKKTKFLSCVSLAAAFFLIFTTVGSIYYKTGITKYRLTNGGVPFTVYMLVGFNFETGGMFSADDQNIYFEAGKDKDKMAEIVKERLIKRISDNKEKIIGLMFKKTNTIFGYGEFNSVYWSYGNNGTEGAKPYLYTLYRTASVYYIMLLALCLYIALTSKNKGLLCLLALMILGFEGGLMLMEVQSRYTYSVAYIFVIIASSALFDIGHHKKNRG